MTTQTTDTAPVTESTEWPQILARLEKIIALESAAGTPAEAEAAAAAMTRLLTRYNLSRADVSKRLDGQKGAAFEEQHYRVTSADWRRTLIGGVARNVFCRVLFSGPTAYIIGDPNNVAAVVAMYERIAGEIDRLADIAWANLEEKPTSWRHAWNSYGRYDGRTKHDTRRWKTDYRNGAVAGVVQAMYDARKAAVAEVADGSALVIVRDAAVRDEVNRRYPRTRSMRSSRSTGHHDAYERGRADGGSIRIHDQLG